MRLYYCFVTGTTVLAGILCGHEANEALRFVWRDAILLTVGFLAWGVNQIFSDYLDRKEDSINAPHRPMVTGALHTRPALLLSTIFMLLFAAASAFVSLWTLPMLAVGAVLNAAYSLLKRVPVVNFLIYALAITCCALYGYAGTTNKCPDIAVIVLTTMLILPIHCLMCHNSYYKDIAGDRIAGVRTLQTCLPQGISLAVSVMLFSIHILQMVFLVKPIFLAADLLPFVSMLIHTILLLILMSLLLKNLKKQTFHKATCLNCQLCVAMLYTPMLAQYGHMLIPEILSLTAIQLLFFWYNDEKE